MHHPGRISGGTLLVTLGGALLLVRAPAVRADGARRKAPSEDSVCLSAYKSAQARQQTGDLVTARELYGKCSDAACGSDLWLACMEREGQLHSEVPSVVLMVSDHKGEPLVDVQVEVDGRLLTSRLDGLALPINPGTHAFAFSASGEAFAPQTVKLAVGDHNHLIAAIGQPRNVQAQR